LDNGRRTEDDMNLIYIRKKEENKRMELKERG
jgi:hypothetical protein